jgi:hypothetical protein
MATSPYSVHKNSNLIHGNLNSMSLPSSIRPPEANDGVCPTAGRPMLYTVMARGTPRSCPMESLAALNDGRSISGMPAVRSWGSALPLQSPLRDGQGLLRGGQDNRVGPLGHHGHLGRLAESREIGSVRPLHKSPRSPGTLAIPGYRPYASKVPSCPIDPARQSVENREFPTLSDSSTA